MQLLTLQVCLRFNKIIHYYFNEKLVLTASFYFFVVQTVNARFAANLQCGYMINPRGIKEAKPILSRNGNTECAYLLQVASDTVFSHLFRLVKGNNRYGQLVYKGKPLQPFTRFCGKLSARYKNGKAVAAALYENRPIDAGGDISISHMMFWEINA